MNECEKGFALTSKTNRIFIQFKFTLRCVDNKVSSCSLLDPFATFLSSMQATSITLIASSNDVNFFTSLIGINHYLNEYASASNRSIDYGSVVRTVAPLVITPSRRILAFVEPFVV